MVSYKELYEQVGSVVGWNFSKIDMRKKVFGEKWDFLEIVKNYVTLESFLLDIGTGGGKKLLSLARSVKKAYGIDNQKSMITTAKKNLIKIQNANVEFRLADAKELPFPLECFDVVMCRHSSFYAEEVFRVLKSGGVFLTQQVHSAEDKMNIKRIFGRGQGFGEKPLSLMNRYLQELKKAKFKILRADTYNATEYYADMADLIFLLRNTPLIPNFNIDLAQRYLGAIEERYKTKDGIKTNSARFLIICKKPW